MENQSEEKIETVDDLARLIRRTLPTKDDLNNELEKLRLELLEHIKDVDDRVTAIQQGMINMSHHLAHERRIRAIEEQLDIQPSL